MEIKAVIAIVRSDALEAVETKLQQAGVQGITVTKSKGYGDHRNFFTRDWMSNGVRIEIYTAADRVGAIVDAITGAAYTGEPGDGLIVVLPVDQAFSVRTRSETVPNRPRH